LVLVEYRGSPHVFFFQIICLACRLCHLISKKELPVSLGLPGASFSYNAPFVVFF
jgi:hypothetical protein